MPKYRVMLTETVVRRRVFEKESMMTRQELESRLEGLFGGRIETVAYFGGKPELLYPPKLDVTVIPLLSDEEVQDGN